MTFPDAVRRCFTLYATFAGRARRSEFWFFWLFNLLAHGVAGILDAAFFGIASPLNAIVSLLLLVPNLAVGGAAAARCGAQWLVAADRAGASARHPGAAVLVRKPRRGRAEPFRRRPPRHPAAQPGAALAGRAIEVCLRPRPLGAGRGSRPRSARDRGRHARRSCAPAPRQAGAYRPGAAPRGSRIAPDARFGTAHRAG